MSGQSGMSDMANLTSLAKWSIWPILAKVTHILPVIGRFLAVYAPVMDPYFGQFWCFTGSILSTLCQNSQFTVYTIMHPCGTPAHAPILTPGTDPTAAGHHGLQVTPGLDTGQCGTVHTSDLTVLAGPLAD